ncbi:hypothetical protein CGZ93_10560 [Enemella dayhoffiae]|uniref:ADP-ribosylglycohydrolase n=1 Tax=Enemella dayhoffiae TaxID=2016507 RepID=A0A255H2A5_9ACTN|nr:hypothetical protein CGZ93_10560 [Enemella dayhoffiae]
MNLLEDKAIGVLQGAAVGDAIGGATEGRSAEEIVERYDGYVTGIVDYFMPDWRTAKPMSPYHKGDGHVTDDTLMTNLLIDVYETVGGHLTPFDIAEHLVPAMMTKITWIPELERETVPLLRVFLAEKWLVTRLYYGHIDPREAGVGNVVNCGAAMYMAPVGIANAGDPDGAYAEAIDLAGAHQLSYGREAAGVFAAAVAASMTPGTTVDEVLAHTVRLARDGTRSAIEAVLEAADRVTGEGAERWGNAIAPLRDAIRPFDTVGEHYRVPAQDSRRPSRLKSIEELPVALGFVKVTDGDARGSILGATNYGRDSDSIATMGGAICGGLHGSSGIPAEWVEKVGTASRLDLTGGGRRMAEVARRVRQADEERAAARTNAWHALVGGGPQ